MTFFRDMMMNSSCTESIFTRQHYLTTVVAPAPDSHGHGAGFTLAQLRNESGKEGKPNFVSADVLTLGAVRNYDDGSIFSISSFFSKLGEII